MRPRARLPQGQALAALAREGFESSARGAALLGFTATEATAGVLLASRVKDKATLPGGHVVNLVVDAAWELLPLLAPPPPPTAAAPGGVTGGAGGGGAGGAPADADFWRVLQQHSVAGDHFYCETADLTRPFPSTHPPGDPAPEFVWNAWLSAPLRALGLPAHCPALLQGAVEAADEVHPTGQRYSLALVSRRSRRHPGTRYLARGLNALAGPGNEIEAELLMWTPSAGAARGDPGGGGGGGRQGAVRWARVAWRRGTVPIWWGVELQSLNKGLQAEVYVRGEGAFVGTLTYLRALQRQFAGEGPACAAAGGGGGGDSATSGSGSSSPEGEALDAQVTCVNLLHKSESKASEFLLHERFQDVSAGRRAGKGWGVGGGGWVRPCCHRSLRVERPSDFCWSTRLTPPHPSPCASGRRCRACARWAAAWAPAPCSCSTSTGTTT